MGVLVRSLISSMIAFMALGLMFSLVALAACIVARLRGKDSRGGTPATRAPCEGHTHTLEHGITDKQPGSVRCSYSYLLVRPGELSDCALWQVGNRARRPESFLRPVVRL